MGSFSEVVLTFDFREDTPAHVLAAVSALHQPVPDDSWYGSGPELPAPVREPVQGWSPDWREAGTTDEFEHEPWRHDWSTWLAGSMMSISTLPSAALMWTPTKRWNLTCRCAFKSSADVVFEFIEWVGPFIDSAMEDQPRLLGYIYDEEEPRPFLLWIRNRRLVMEDLN